MSIELSSERTLAMTVRNTGFMVDRLGQDCAPLQFLRELTQNSIEAIQRGNGSGEIVWDVDWDTYELTGVFKLCITDDGCGMTGEEMVQYINQLSSSVSEQSHEGNFGVGAKIAAATRNHHGLIYLSWREGTGSMIHLWRDPESGQYGLRQQQRPNGTFGHWAHVEDTVKPRENPKVELHGTKVVLLGNDPEQNTMQAPSGAPSPSQWVARYLNTRYFRFPEGIRVRARQGWESPRADTNNNVLRTLEGQEKYLETHAESSGNKTLTGATARWWILKDEPALTQNSGRIASAGHSAALYRNELYEMLTGRAATSRLQQFGVVFGHQRVVIYIEPHGDSAHVVSANTARTQLLLDQEPLPWADWAAEFRSDLPLEISTLMEEITAGASQSDHKAAIRERLKQIRDLFRFSRYRPSPSGDKTIVEGGSPGGRAQDKSSAGEKDARSSGGPSGGRAGNIYALFLADEGQLGEEVFTNNEPEVAWITVEEGTRTPGFLEDRAAKFLPEQNLLQINGDFRGFTDMVDRWCDFYADTPGARRDIVDVCREWFEQSLVETVLGVQALKDSREWTVEDIGKSMSEEALTAAVMPRYHIDVAVKRALGAKLGSLKDRVS